MSHFLRIYLLKDVTGRRFYFRPNATFMVPDEAPIRFAFDLAERCHACGCSPCFGVYLKHEPFVSSGIQEESNCESYPYALFPGLLEEILSRFVAIDGKGGVAMSSFSEKLALAHLRARVIELEAVSVAYSFMGIKVRRGGYNITPGMSELASHFKMVMTKACANLEAAVEDAYYTQDVLLLATYAHAFNCSAKNYTIDFAFYDVEFWAETVLAVPISTYSSVVIAVKSPFWKVLSSSATRQERSFEAPSPRGSCVRILHHVAGGNGEPSEHVYGMCLPWMTYDHPVGVLQSVVHHVVCGLIAPSAAFVEQYGFTNRYRPCDQTLRRFMGPPCSYACPEPSCLPPCELETISINRGSHTFSSWVGLSDREVNAAAARHEEYSCWHSDPEGESGYMKYGFYRHVLNNGCNRITSNVRMGTQLEYEEVASAKRFKQFHNAPTSRCAGMTESSPFCSEMGLSLR